MNEKYKGLIVIVIMIALISGIVTVSILEGNKEDRDLTYNQSSNNNDNVNSGGNYVTDWKTAFESEEKKIIYLGRPTCSWCSQFRPGLNYLSKTYGFEFVYVNTDELSSSEFQSILAKLGINSSEFGTPYTAIVQNGKVIDAVDGYTAESSLFSFFQRNGIIGKDQTYKASISDEFEDLTILDYRGYQNMYESGEKSILVLGQTTCGYCSQFKPIINEIAKEYGIKIHYMDINTLTSDDRNALIDSLDYFKTVERWGTPLTLIIENKKVVATQSGYKDKSGTVSFLKEEKMIKN